jgi:alpha-L-rhamnosidase
MTEILRDKAAFIWTPHQKISHSNYNAMMHSGPHRRSDGENRWYFLRRSFDVSGSVDEAVFSLTVDGKYELRINGCFVGIGPARSSPRRRRTDSYDVAHLLKPGTNTIAILCYVPGRDLGWYEAMIGSWQPVFGDGGFWGLLEGSIDNREFKIRSDCNWKIMQAECWQQDSRIEGWGQGHMEVIQGSKYPWGWDSSDFDDQNWDQAVEMRAVGTSNDEAIGRGPIRPFPVLVPRGMPNLTTDLLSPVRVFWTGSVAEKSDGLLPEKAFDLTVMQAPASVKNCENGWSLVSSPGRGVAISFVFDYHTGRPKVEIDAKGGEIIDITISERLPGEPKEEIPGPLVRVGPHAPSNAMRFIAKPGLQTIEKFEWSAIRGLQIVVYNALKGLDIRSVESRLVRYPVESLGQFQCSDSELNKLWEKGANTAQWCVHDSWEDCPSREKRQWITDACVAFEVSATAFGPVVFPVHKAFIEEVVLGQRVDGLFQMYVPGDHGHTGVVIPDYSLQFILSLGKYYQLSGDLETVENAMHAVERCLNSLDGYLSVNGLLKDVPEWHFIEWVHLGRNGEAGPINVLYAKALKVAAELAEHTERKRLSSRWSSQSQRAIDALEARHWNAEQGVYVDEVDPATGVQGERISQHMNAMMIAFRFAPEDRWDAIVTKITDTTRVRLTSAPPIVTRTGPFNPSKHIVSTNTYFSRYLNEALDLVGRFDAALIKMRSSYKEMVEASTSTLWESFSDEASLCHVFSAGPVFQLVEKVLGVVPLSAGVSEVCIDIRTAGLTWAKGRLPTPFGIISISWELNEGRLELDVKAPDEIKIQVKIPQGFDCHEISNGKHCFWQSTQKNLLEKTP